MSILDEYKRLKKKEEEEEAKKASSKSPSSVLEEYNRIKAEEEDIAPVAENKPTTWETMKYAASILPRNRKSDKDDAGEDQRKWFQKGALEDGVTVGNVAKSILGTFADTSKNISAGILGIGEKVVDAGAYLVGGVGGLLGADKFQSKTQEFIAKDLYDEEKLAEKIGTYAPFSVLGNPAQLISNAIGVKDTDETSFLGERTDSLLQSGGQLLGTMGLQAVGVPWFVTSGVTSFGAETENAFNEGASYGEAGLSAAISAGAEILTEKLFAGSGLGEQGLIDLEPLTKGISSKLVRTLASFGVDMAAEGSEEVVSQFAGNLASALYKEENLGDILFSEEAVDGYIESFVGGFALGGAANVGNVPNSIRTGRDYRTGLTDSEQAVIDKVYNDAIKEAEKDGKLSQAQKRKIYEAVVSEMDKGYISTDTIEEVLGGETYKTYKDTTTSENALIKEYEELGNLKESEMTAIQKKRFNELDQMIADNKKSNTLGQIRTKLSDEVSGLVKDSRLYESYNQKALRGQAFEADLTQYDTKQQETVKRAIDSGILNNTRRTHELVDLVAKLSADKGVLFDFTNNAKLKEAGFAIDGKQVNGFVKDGTVTINTQSAKYINSVVGHEVTHIMEGTDLYKTLQDTVFEYAKTKGEYQTRYDSLAELYKDIEGADIEAELTADLVGDYLFTDADFINNLSTKNRNVFQKIYDEIKYLYKTATAGSKEARELEKVKKAFDNAYRANIKAQTGMKNSITEPFVDSNGTHFDNAVLLDTDFFDGVHPRNWGEKLRTMVNERAESNPLILPIVDENGNTILLQFANPKDRVKKDGGASHRVLDELSSASDNVSKLAVVHIDEIVSVSEENSPYYTNENNHQWLDKNGWLHRNANVINQKNGNIYNLTVDIAKAADGRMIMYATDGKIKKVGNVDVNSLKIKGSRQNSNFDHNVAQEKPIVKGQFSLSDSTGKQLTKEQQDYFKDSKMRDDNGNLMVMYHGSQDAGFHTFDAGMSDDGTSFFFVDRNDVAASYSGTSETYEAKSFKTVDDANSFFAEIGKTEYEVVEKDGEYTLYDDGDEVATSKSLDKIYEEFCDWEGVGYGDANYKVYLNLKNPLVVDAKGKNWNNLSREYSQEIADRYNSLTAEEKSALADIAGWEEYGIFRDELLSVAKAASEGKLDEHSKILASAYNKLGGANANLFDAFSIAGDNFSEEAIKQFAVKQMNTRDYAQRAKEQGYDGVIFKNIVDNGGYSNGSEGASTVAIAFDSNQIKSVANNKPTADPDIRHSLSNPGDTPKKYGNYAVSGKDIALDVAPEAVEQPVQTENAPVNDVAPVAETIAKTEPVSIAQDEVLPDDYAPISTELDMLLQEKETLESRMADMAETDDYTDFDSVMERYAEVSPRIEKLEAEAAAEEADRINSLDDTDVPPEIEAPYPGDPSNTQVDNPFDDRNWYEVGNRNVKAYMYENPEVKTFFQEEAMKLMGELSDTTKGERWYNDDLYYETGGEKGFGGVKRHTSDSIAELLDSWDMSYADIEKGLNAIIEDHGAENIAAAKKIEFMLNDRLLNGYKDFYTNSYTQPNQEYINLLNEKQINEYSKESFDKFMETADQYAPVAEVAEENTVTEAPKAVVQDAPVAEKYEAIRPNQKQAKEPRMIRADKAQQTTEQTKVAEVMSEEPQTAKKNIRAWSRFLANFADKGSVFETLSIRTKNRELQARYNSLHYAEGRAQKLLGEGTVGIKSLNDIRTEVEKTGKTKQFYEYLYHLHNVDRMQLEGRYKDTPNKPVFGDTVTADMSRAAATKLAKENPEFRSWAQDVYRFNSHLRKMLVDGGVISQETADLWSEMYPHYVPIRRAGDDGLNIDVPLDTRKTGVNAPVKRATGGSRDILPLFDTMAQRTLQTYKAIAKNRFGVELKNTLGTTIEKEAASIDGVIDSVDHQEGLLQEGKNGKAPTFTVFENGEKVTFEITEEMYDALKPTSSGLAYTNKVANSISNFRRGLLTEYNPTFILTNAIKDAQDVLINSQHAIKTYATFPKAIQQLASKGEWYTEYMENGGEQNTYFDNENNTFKKEKSTFVKVIGSPLEAISIANNFIERVPRLAEYIASREAGRSIDVSMLDAARVTTNFAAGGDVTKFLNRNGATFLNASVQGFMQNVRNVREAKANGLKGVGVLAAKVAAAGLSGLLLNHLLWDDDEDYEELSDYVKQNYYIVGKYGDGQFVRIPKGRMLAVIQNAFEQMQNAITGDDEVDLQTFGDLFFSNLAPNDPIDNNIISPIIQVAKNKTWYGEDLIPTRLQDLPAAEQFDETTDAISKWLGEKLDVSPVKINYLLDQYSGGIGDTFLPMLTPAAERGDKSFAGKMIAPLKDKFTTDSVLKNQNVSDFYDKVDELAVNANSSKATDDDVLKSKYMNSINTELSELYKQKRDIQNSDLSDEEKYTQVRAVQQQIVDLAKNGLSTFEDIHYESDGEYAVIGDKYFQWYTPEEGDPYWRKLTESQVTKYNLTKDAGNAHYVTDGNVHYRLDKDGEWTKISDKQLERQNEVTKALGITPDEYWRKTEISFLPMSDGEYEYAFDNPDNYAVAKAVGGYDSYKTYSSELYNIKADKDENGKSITGSRKEKVIDYINGLDADYGEKIILLKSEYPADDSYNEDIIEYLNSREDITYDEMETILKELGFKVSSDGTITWD